MAKVIGLKQLISKKHKFLEGLPADIMDSFGQLVENFVMIIWGMSGQGKSSLIMMFLKALMPYGKVLYVALEEGFEATTQFNVLRSLSEEQHTGKIEFADHEMKFDELVKKLKKKKSPRFNVIDSVQYWDVTYDKYKQLKEMFPKKTFIFISHASGKLPDGKTADKIRYDAGVKVRVEGFVAFVASRYGGNNPYVIWEDGAKRHWGKDYKKVIKGIELKPKTKKQDGKEKGESEKDTSIPAGKSLDESSELVLGVQTEVERES